MNGDLALRWAGLQADMGIVGNDLETDAGLETAVVISLFSDRRAETGDTLPSGDRDPRGWWGDGVADIDGDRIGSRLWLLCREKQMAAVLARAEEYAREALAWLLDDAIAEHVLVTASFLRAGWLGLEVTITRPRGTRVSYRYDYAWDGQAARMEAA